MPTLNPKNPFVCSICASNHCCCMGGCNRCGLRNPKTAEGTRAYVEAYCRDPITAEEKAEAERRERIQKYRLNLKDADVLHARYRKSKAPQQKWVPSKWTQSEEQKGGNQQHIHRRGG